MILSGHFQKFMAVKVIVKTPKKIDSPYKKYVCRITGFFLVIKKLYSVYYPMLFYFYIFRKI